MLARARPTRKTLSLFIFEIPPPPNFFFSCKGCFLVVAFGVGRGKNYQFKVK
jgi:hypothetical protein